MKKTDVIKDTNKKLGYQHNNRAIFTIQNIASNILFIVNSAGLNDANYMQMLRELEQDDKDTAYNEIEDILLMLGEIIYQFQSYQKAGNVFIDKNPSHTLTSILKNALETIKNIPQPGKERKIPEVKYFGDQQNSA